MNKVNSKVYLISGILFLVAGCLLFIFFAKVTLNPLYIFIVLLRSFLVFFGFVLFTFALAKKRMEDGKIKASSLFRALTPAQKFFDVAMILIMIGVVLINISDMGIGIITIIVSFWIICIFYSVVLLITWYLKEAIKKAIKKGSPAENKTINKNTSNNRSEIVNSNKTANCNKTVVNNTKTIFPNPAPHCCTRCGIDLRLLKSNQIVTIDRKRFCDVCADLIKNTPKQTCSVCNNLFPSVELSSICGRKFCHDCSSKYFRGELKDLNLNLTLPYGSAVKSKAELPAPEAAKAAKAVEAAKIVEAAKTVEADKAVEAAKPVGSAKTVGTAGAAQPEIKKQPEATTVTEEKSRFKCSACGLEYSDREFHLVDDNYYCGRCFDRFYGTGEGRINDNCETEIVRFDRKLFVQTYKDALAPRLPDNIDEIETQQKLLMNLERVIPAVKASFVSEHEIEMIKRGTIKKQAGLAKIALNVEYALFNALPQQSDKWDYVSNYNLIDAFILLDYYCFLLSADPDSDLTIARDTLGVVLEKRFNKRLS